jgi:hypothetical protein
VEEHERVSEAAMDALAQQIRAYLLGELLRCSGLYVA